MKRSLVVLLSVFVLAAAKPAPRVITVKVTAGDFQPSVVKIAKGESVRLKFIRIADPSCGTHVAIPSLKLKKELPLNQPVFVDVKADKTGDIGFTCGMGMMEGQIVVQ